jgi:hypothetical protein
VPEPYPVNVHTVPVTVERQILPCEAEVPALFAGETLFDRSYPTFAPRLDSGIFAPHAFEKFAPYGVERNIRYDVDKYSGPLYQPWGVDLETFAPYPLEKVGHYGLGGPFSTFSSEFYHQPLSKHFG